jgi:exodeoxyribonuclease V alpha subunit
LVEGTILSSPLLLSEKGGDCTDNSNNNTNIDDLIYEFNRKENINLHILQRTAVNAFFEPPKNGIYVLTGYPGTGKSSVVKCVWYIAEQMRLKVLTCAPTGKAANRLGQDAMTIHRALKYKGNGFEHNSNNPLDFDIIIVDEVSMLDLNIAYSLFNAIKVTKTRVLLIGDENQLPSVGYGNTLNDILKSCVVPHTHLTKIYRQGDGSKIARLGRCIIKSSGETKLPQYFTDIVGDDNNTKDIVYYQLHDPRKIHEMVLKLLMKHRKNNKESGSGSGSDNTFQILVPTKKGPVGTSAINSTIHRYLYKITNIEDLSYQPFERIMVVSNVYAKTDNGLINQDDSVFNGESGEFIEYANDKNKKMGKVNIRVDGKTNDIEVDQDCIDFGYAITVNKAQGSEYETVVLVLHDSHNIMLNRKVFYTGITRAKKKLHIIGTDQCLARAINYNLTDRITALSERLADCFDIVSSSGR